MTAGPSNNRRVATWEKRLKVPVLVAATAVLPLVALGLSHPEGAWHTVETAGHWAVWLTFVVEVAIMLTVVDDRAAWAAGHKFELLVVVVSSPLLPLALAVAPALRLLAIAKAFKALKLSKAVKLAKLHKSVRVLRRKLGLTGVASVLLGSLALVLGGLMAAYMVTGSSPLRGAEHIAILTAAGVLVTFGVSHLPLAQSHPTEPTDRQRVGDGRGLFAAYPEGYMIGNGGGFSPSPSTGPTGGAVALGRSKIDVVTPQDALSLHEQGAVLLDVREPDEWAAGHAPGATHVPLANVSDAAAQFSDRDVVTVCRSGRRSAEAAKALAQAGIKVRNLGGGMTSWAASGLPVVRDDGAPGEIV